MKKFLSIVPKRIVLMLLFGMISSLIIWILSLFSFILESIFCTLFILIFIYAWKKSKRPIIKVWLDKPFYTK